ncbi:uncharacterized protein LOC144120175 [Amblyomma americanum]
MEQFVSSPPGARGNQSTAAASPVPRTAALQDTGLMRHGHQQQQHGRPRVAPPGKPRPAAGVATPSDSRILSSSDGIPRMPSPFNSLLMLPSDERTSQRDIRPDSSWTLPQICIGLCGAVAFVLAILFAGTLAVRTLQTYELLRPVTSGKLKEPMGQSTGPATITAVMDSGAALNTTETAFPNVTP